MSDIRQDKEMLRMNDRIAKIKETLELAEANTPGYDNQHLINRLVIKTLTLIVEELEEQSEKGRDD